MIRYRNPLRGEGSKSKPTLDESLVDSDTPGSPIVSHSALVPCTLHSDWHSGDRFYTQEH